jgi:preprotein translocase subunit SecA
MFNSILDIFARRRKNRQEYKSETDYLRLVDQINKYNLSNISDSELQSCINKLKSQIFEWELLSKKNLKKTDDKEKINYELRKLMVNGTFISDFLVESFAVTKELCRRKLGLEPFDSQLLTGIALHFGKIAELPTGEGKTLAAVFPAVLNALTGRGTHIFTFNDYLAKRDANWMKAIYNAWGLNVEYIEQWMDSKQRYKAYNADITYVTSKEAGFDYLRDSLVYSEAELVHRPFNYVIVDEADSILIDEARVPLVIAGNVANLYNIDKHLVEIVSTLHLNIDYRTDENLRSVYLTETGIERLERILNCGNLYRNKNIGLLTSINNLIHAKELLRKDIDYIVRDNKIEIIDEFTGRVAERRKWHDGLQMAVEAIEGIDCTQNSRILGKITLQHFVSLYPEMCGMTATAKSSEEEFRDIYNREVFQVESHKKCIRIDYPDMVFAHKRAKYRAVVDEIEKMHKTGRPILLGTANIEESEMLAVMLKAKNIDVVVLNAKNDAEEAEIIAKAGRFGAVTVSTNMAGRGVDIKLGDGDDPEQRDKVIDLGGLYVIGISKNECARIDNQLRGRSGRQGDPGTSRFYVSLKDDLLDRFEIKKVLPQKYINLDQFEEIKDKKLNDLIDHIQRVVNGQNFEIRTTLGKYSLLLEYQRCILSKKRTDIMCGRHKSVLEEEKPDEYSSLCEAYGKTRVAEIEQKVAMHTIDESWFDFLEVCDSIKEGINLISADGKKDPVDEYRKLVSEEFDNIYKNMDEAILEALENTDFSMDDDAFAKNGLHTPSSTWTYIINDEIKVKRFSLFNFMK